MRALLTALCAGFLLSCSSSERFAETPPIVTTTGAVQAVQGGFATHKFYDIPYAKAPVGALRWRAPQPLPASDSLLPRLDAELMCPQEASEVSGIEGDAIVGVEDCLYLDVYAPSQVSAALPVMFWIHGGGNTSGRKGTYDFSRLVAEQNVVVVAINYRLGPLGWFHHPAVNGGSGAIANFGTLDIIAALGWVQQNIESFGGDAGNVTIFGESAGGHNVFTLLASPLSEGLFHKAIAQSGYVKSMSMRQAFNREREFEQIDAGSWELAEALGYDGDAITAEDFRSISSDRLLEVFYSIDVDHISPGIINDGIVIPTEGFASALNNPAYAKKGVPVMAGSNRDEVTLWLGLNRYFVDVSYPLTKLAPPKIRLKNKPVYDFWVRQRSEGWKAGGVDGPLTALESAGYDSLYAYRYDWDEQYDIFLLKFSELFGAAHASEISFIQGAPMYGSIGSFMYPDTESAEQMTQTMMRAWGNFARTGAPGTVAGDPWPSYSAAAPHYMVLDVGDNAGLRFGATSVQTVLNAVADDSLLSPEERCILAWELSTAINDPNYGLYHRWNNGECADVDVRALRESIEAALIKQYGSASAL
jgi:para-nitrobenzyl esterase